MPQLSTNEASDRPFSVFTPHEKWFIVSVVAFAGIFSPFTANIYLPALPTISKVFQKSVELINLTVTMYMVMQGIAPMVWGPISDSQGRRPIFIACLTILVLTCVGLALVPASAYWLLMLLRCLQAAGSASTIALGAGVIGDISEPKERGVFFGMFTIGPMVGPAVGPVIGGALSQHLGWRSRILLVITVELLMVCAIFRFLPETLRSIVGDGSVLPSLIYRPVIPIIRKRGESCYESVSPKKGMQNPFRLLMYVDIIMLLVLTALVCAVYYGYIATISTLFVTAYPFLSETEIGLCYLAIGGGMVIGSICNGKLLDWQFRKFSEKVGGRYPAENGPEPVRVPGGKQNVPLHFPIEQARLRFLPILLVLLVVCSAGYGWCIEKKVNLAAPLIIQIVVGYISIAVMNSAQTLMIDLFPGQSSSITACNNFVRCTLSAVLVSIIDIIFNGIGIGWTFVLLAGLSLLGIPFIYLVIWIGPRCRSKRQKKAV
ncbi:Quinidine resistance protein 2 [Termitomyces sp. J132]|nr:Quinidine resistance protein 2 [Termitomyces sp. J132]